MIMCAVYLTYSAYFLSADFVGISYFMKVSIESNFKFLGINDHIVPWSWFCQHKEPERQRQNDLKLSTSKLEG
jgi:hypothetical protein